MNAADARRQLEAAVHKQLAVAWAAGATSAQLPPTDDPLEVAIRVAARQRILSGAARAILRARTRLEQATAERTGKAAP